MIKRKLVDILIAIAFVTILLVICLMLQPNQVFCEDTEEMVNVSKIELPTVGNVSETEEITEEQTVNEEIVTEITEDTVTEQEENTYYCEWLDTEISQEEFKLLCRTTYCEAGGESKKAQVMVCITILNRLRSDKFPDSIHGVIYAKNAFSVTRLKGFKNTKWNARTEKAVQQALKENKYPKDMFYFRDGRYHRWAKNYKKVGSMYFSTED